MLASTKASPLGVDFTPTIHADTYAYINPKQHDLTGRAVLITGASKGIGRATAISFATAGASHIAIGARSSLDDVVSGILKAAEQAGREKPQVLTLQLDVESYENVASCAEKVKTEFGRLDILVNNAGYAEKFIPMTEVDPESWAKTWSVNIIGVFHVTRAFLPLLKQTENGLREILMVSSIGANSISSGGSAYRPSKLALIRFGEFVGVENPEILVYDIHPGGVVTELSASLPEATFASLKDKPELAGDSIVWLTASRKEWLQNRYVSVTWDMKELLDKREVIESENLLRVRIDFGHL